MDARFEAHMASFHTEGLVHIPNLLTLEAVEVYREALEAALTAQDARWGSSPYYADQGMVHNPMIYDPVFLEFLGHSGMQAYLERALDPHCILYAFTTSSMPPSGQNFSTRIHVDSPRVIPDYVTNVGFFVSLTDFTKDNGATYYLPHSFEQLEPPSEEAFFANAVRPMLKAGDAVMFNARTWHAGGQNCTDQYRHALTLNVCRSYMRQRFDYPRMLGTDKLDQLDERLLKFLGYRVRIPVDLDDYYVPPDKRLYYGGQG